MNYKTAMGRVAALASDSEKAEQAALSVGDKAAADALRVIRRAIGEVEKKVETYFDLQDKRFYNKRTEK